MMHFAQLRRMRWGRIAAVTLALLVLSGCSGERPYVWVSSLPAGAEEREAHIAPGDRIFVLVQGQEAMSGELLVREDGSIVLAVVGRVDLAGATPTEAGRRVTERLHGVVVDPKVTVAIVSTSAKISVVGEVAHPGPFAVGPNDGVLDALAKAGGLSEFADKDGIFVLRRGEPTQRIRFRYSDLVGADAKSLSFRLRNADVVVVE